MLADRILVKGDPGAQGSPGLQVPTYSNDVGTLPIYVDADGSGDFFGLRWPTLEIVGRPEVTAVRLLGPSVVTADDILGDLGRLLPTAIVVAVLALGLAIFRREEGGFAERL